MQRVGGAEVTICRSFREVPMLAWPVRGGTHDGSQQKLSEGEAEHAFK
jgi:hypothetical protein